MRLWGSLVTFRKAHQDAGGTFFDAGRMQAMRRRLETAGACFDGRWFVTSEARRCFTVWECCDDASVKLCGKLGAYGTLKGAENRIGELHAMLGLPRKRMFKATAWKEVVREHATEAG